MIKLKYLGWIIQLSMKIKAQDLALVSLFSAACIVVGYGKGLSLPFLPGVVEFMAVVVFVSGFMFGWVVGALNGALTLAVYMLVPSSFAHPSAWLFVISPVLLIIMAGLGALYGLVGGIVGKRYRLKNITPKFVLMMALWGFVLTFVYDILSSVGFYVAYPGIYPSVWEAILLTFIPAWMPYPPIVHTVTNTIIFGLVAPPLIKAISVFRRS